jgi:hypothetical protein
MARARNIKPGFFTHDGLAELDPLTRLLFIGLWTVADRAGRMEDRPKRIKAEVMPYDDCDVEAMLNALHAGGFILRYRAGEVAAIQIVKWDKHQNPHMKESESTIPAPCEHGANMVQVPVKAVMAETPSTEQARRIPDSGFPLPDSPTTPNGVERAKPARRPLVPKPDDVTERTWMDWQQLRKSKRAPVTATVVDGARAQSELAGMSLEQFLQVWCRRGSQGLEAAWLRPDERGSARAPPEPAWRTEQRQRTQIAAPGVTAQTAPDFFLDVESRNVPSDRLGGSHLRQADTDLRPILSAPVE